MIVKRIARTEDGNAEVTLMLTPEQAVFIMNMGLSVLVQKGAATFKDYANEEEFLADPENKQVVDSAVQQEAATTVPTEQKPANTELDAKQKAFLESVDVNLLPKA